MRDSRKDHETATTPTNAACHGGGRNFCSWVRNALDFSCSRFGPGKNPCALPSVPPRRWAFCLQSEDRTCQCQKEWLQPWRILLCA